MEDSGGIILTISMMLVALLAEGFFSGSEIGVVSADKMKLRHDAAKGSKGAKLVLTMLKDPEWLLSTTLVGTNIAVVTNTTLATALMIQLGWPSWMAIVIVAPLIWICGEIVPKSVFQQRANFIAPKVIYALRFFSYLFYPILIVFSFLAGLFSKLVSGKADQSPFTLREEIKSMVEMSPEEGDIRPEEQTMIRRLFSFSDTKVREIMVPLVDVVSVDRNTTVGEVKKLAAMSRHKRLPIHEGRVDKMVGIVDTMEFLGVDPDQPVAAFMKTPDYVPVTKPIQVLLADMRREGNVLSVVVDEFGGAEGVVTIEDILEEVVDELYDEYDADEKPVQWIRKTGERDYHVSARVELDTLKELGVELPDGQYASLAGFLLEKALDIPTAGTVIEFQSITFTIERATPQAIQEVRIQW